jgi:hypothetical protein
LTDATTPSELFSSIPAVLEVVRNLLSGFANFPIADPATLSSPTGIINDLSGTFSADYALGLPIADTENALLTSLPAAFVNLLTDSFQSGNPLGAIEEAIGGAYGLIPFAVTYGEIFPIAEALGGTLVNLIDLIPGF